MARFVTGADADVAEWVRRRCPGVTGWGPCTAVGLAENERLIAGVVFSRFYPGISIDLSIAAEPGRCWLTRGFLERVFVYPFRQLKVQKVQCFIPASNQRSERLCAGLGFSLEGRLRASWHDGEDLLAYGMLASECRSG